MKSSKLLVYTAVIFLLSFIGAIILNDSLFFEQDEYYLFHYCNSLTPPYLSLLGNHFTPLRDWLYCSQYFIFNLDIFPRVIIALALHIMTILSVVALLKKLDIYHNLFTPLLVFIFLGINVLVSQAYLWMSTYSGTMPCILLSIWSIMYFLNYLQTKKRKDIILSYVLLIAALLFKEYALFLFPFYMTVPVILTKGKLGKNFNKFKMLLTINGILFILFIIVRLLIQMLPGAASSQVVVSKFSVEGIVTSLEAYVLIGAKSFWQIIFPYNFIKYSTSPALTESTIENTQNIFGLILIIVVCVILLSSKRLKIKSGDFRKIILGLLLFLCALIPFTIISNSVNTFYLEPRYYYLISTALLVFVSAVLKQELRSVTIRQ